MRDEQILAAGVVEHVLAGRALDQELAALWRNNASANAHRRALVQDLCYGVLRHLGALDAMLVPLLNKPLRDERLRHLLRVALYQLEHTRAAPHAVVDHAVAACVALRAAPAKGLVNAILRGFLRRSAELRATCSHGDTGRYSYPQWWVDKIRTQHPDDFAGILEAGNRHAPLTLRVNTRRITREAYLERLQAEGIAATALEVHAVVLEKPLPVERLPGFAEGLVSVQDASAQRAAPLLDAHDAHRRLRVLDACAAPGGKTAHLLELADIQLTALDDDAERLKRVRTNLDRLGLNAALVCGDARDPVAWWDGVPFDRILADVPCSASGVTRRHPDIKWLRRPSDIVQFAQTQETVMDALWRLLAAGGKFLYVTCSVFREENHHQVARFLVRHPDAQQQQLSPTEFVPEHAGQILPDARHDGFYYALLRKI
jgi:16S rRNA (cytosine967-C5)-methyltransferase